MPLRLYHKFRELVRGGRESEDRTLMRTNHAEPEHVKFTHEELREGYKDLCEDTEYVKKESN